MSEIETGSVESTVAAAPAKRVLTKEERIAQYDKQIAQLQRRREDCINDVVRTKAAKVTTLPNVGDVVEFTYGRTTPTTNARELVGTVLGARPTGEYEGKKTPALVRVQVGSGFDVEILTIYPSSIKASA